MNIKLTSLLLETSIDHTLALARQMVESQGSATPMLYLQTSAQEVKGIPLELPDSWAEKCGFFVSIGHTLHEDLSKHNQWLTEALLVVECWYVDGQKAPDIHAVPPSQHPCREEAIIAVAVNAKRTRKSLAVQPFTRDEHRQLVWSEVKCAAYNTSTIEEPMWEGLLDLIFHPA